MFRETFHNVAHGAQSQIHDVKTIKMGRITTYDPSKHAVKVLIEQDAGIDAQPAETEFIPLASFAVGDQWGFQYAPMGGASPDNDEGEVCAVLIIQRNSGLMMSAHLLFDDVNEPPGSGADPDDNQQDANDPTGWDGDPNGLSQLQGGEAVWKHNSGSFFKFYQSGDVQMYAAQNLHVYAQQDLDVTVREGDCDLTVEEGNLDIEVEQGNTVINTTNGDVAITSDQGSILVTTNQGDIGIVAPSGEVVVECQDAVVSAQNTINILSSVVNIGSPGVFQNLCNLAFMQLFNGHTHSGVMTGAGVSGVPTVPAVAGIETTISLAAN